MDISLNPRLDILIITAVIALSLALLSWRRSSRRDATYFGWLMLALSIWSITYGLVFITRNPQTQIVLYRLHYLWNLTIPLFILAFAFAFTNNTRFLRKKYFLLLSSPLILNSVLVFTPGLNNLVFESITRTSSAASFGIQIESGWLFWVNFIIAYLIVLTSVYFIFRSMYREESKLLKKQTGIILAVILIPPLLKLLYTLNIGIFSELDPTPLALSFAGIVIYFSVLRYSFLELTPLTQRRLLESLSDGVVIVDHECQIIKANRSAQNILHKSSWELRRKPVSLFLPLEKILPETESIGNTDSTWFHEGRTYEIRRESLVDKQDQNFGALLIIHDITESISYEQQLQERNIYIESILNHLPVGIAAHDLDTGRVLDMNENFEKIYGWSSRDMKTVDDFFRNVYQDPHRRSYWRERIEADITTGDPDRMHWEGVRIHTSEGEERVVNAYNIPITGSNIMISTVEDVTDKYAIAEALRESEQNFRDIFRNMQHGFYRTKPDATIALINPAAAEMLGYESPDALIGDNLYERPEFAKHDTQEFADRMLEQGKVSDYESIFIRKDGEEISVLLDGRPEFSNEGELLYFEGNIIDITDKKKLEQQLLQTQKLESVGRLAGGVAHDFNNLLTSLSMNAELGSMQTENDSEIHDRFADMEDLIAKASRITRQLLQFSREQEMSRESIQMNELVREVLKLLRKMIGEDISIHYEPGTDLPPVYVDGSQIEQVIMNLCINARDAMEEGGDIIIRTSQEANNSGEVSKETQQFVCIDILDTGTGIPADIQDKIFDPFFTTKDPGDGTGLGLSIVHGIIQQHGGWIDLESNENRGTLFSIYLPVSAHQLVEKEEFAADKIVGGDESILLVEDDANIRDSIKAVLTKFGYQVLTADNGKAGLDLLLLNGSSIDMVISDVVMPIMGGNTLFLEAHKQYPELPFLFLSGYPESVIEKKLSESMRTHFHQKPIQIPDLLREVRNTLKAK